MPSRVFDVGAKILDDDVGFCDERTKQRRAVGVFQIDADAALVAMQVLIVGTVTRAGDGSARSVARRRWLDLDDVRAPVGEQSHRGRTRARDRQIEHGVSRQR